MQIRSRSFGESLLHQPVALQSRRKRNDEGPEGGTFSFNDATCVKDGIATISGSGNSYNADWGSKSGSCTAVFTDKNSKGAQIGTAKLHITNKA
jgi:hypothetical protein